MDKQDTLDQEYRLKRRAYEEEEDDLLLQRDKGLFLLEEVGDKLNYYYKDSAQDYDIIRDGLHGLYELKEELEETTKIERKQLERKMDDLEDTYYRQLRELSVNGRNK